MRPHHSFTSLFSHPCAKFQLTTIVCDMCCQNAVNYSYSNFVMPQNVVNFSYIYLTKVEHKRFSPLVRPHQSFTSLFSHPCAKFQLTTIVCDMCCQNAVNYSYSNFVMPQNVVNFSYIYLTKVEHNIAIVILVVHAKPKDLYMLTFFYSPHIAHYKC